MASYSYNTGASSSSSSGPFVASKLRQQSFGDDSSLVDDCLSIVRHLWLSLLDFWNTRSDDAAKALLLQSAHQLRRNLALSRLFSFPHALVAVWVLVMLWGERWVFHTTVERCAWDNWEKWPSEATPHHLIFVADPQIIDPKSYPGRPWPISSLTVAVTDNYMRRSYNQVQEQLHPDTVFFLGDLFDGGREWATLHGDTPDLGWNPRPKSEVGYAKKWKRKYGEAFWLREYTRFVKMFVDPFAAISEAGRGQRGKKFIASLPGNHDLGYGAGVKVPVRERFEAFFGNMNRVDVIANHTFVSVDTLSLSARSSDEKAVADLSQVHGPVDEFLEEVQLAKRKAVERELRHLRGDTPDLRQRHHVEELLSADFGKVPTLDPGEGKAELPTILLSHVPLYRAPGTPCGPLREHWPPASPAQAVDHRNAISVSRGYQYQNVLNEVDSVDLVKRVGNVVHAFSGDDHDYCELTHSNSKENVKEITVKSISMAMGVPTPGFLMVSMYNPIDKEGKPLSGENAQTLQTHLCLLPSQLNTYARYGGFAFVCFVMLTIRAFLVPILHLQQFALDPEKFRAVLPVFKAKREDHDTHKYSNGNGFGSSASSYHTNPNRTGTRDRSASLVPGIKANGLAAQARNAPPKITGGNTGGLGRHNSNKETSRSSKFSWGEGPKIEIDLGEEDEYYYDAGKSRWKASAVRRGGVLSRGNMRIVVRELWTTAWRVLWMTGLYWVWLNWTE